MFNPFAYLREKAREAVLAGVHDALVQIDSGSAPLQPPVTAASPPALSAGPQAPDTEAASEPGAGDTSGNPGESIQQRLARAAVGPGTAPQLPPAPSATKRGRGRPPKGDAS